MTSYLDDKVDDYNVRIQIWWTPGLFSKRYSAQVSCPLSGCKSFYNTSNRNSEGSAATAVKNSLRKHLKAKHSGPSQPETKKSKNKK